MSINRVTAAPGVPPVFPFNLAGAADRICFISGMPSLDADGAFAPGTFEEETERAWRNVVSIAGAAGYSVEEIVYVQCALADIGDYSALNHWWRGQFPDVPTAPARFTFQAAALPFGAKIELQAVAGR